MSVQSVNYEQKVKEKLEYKLSEEDKENFNKLSDAFWVEFYDMILEEKYR
jgi:hypothetical protein